MPHHSLFVPWLVRLNSLHVPCTRYQVVIFSGQWTSLFIIVLCFFQLVSITPWVYFHPKCLGHCKFFVWMSLAKVSQMAAAFDLKR